MSNPEKELARKIVENTNTHLFLTGKAGTGKTTFLRQLRETTAKRMVVLAPTGIAAINAGGVTIHSFLQIPFAPYVPGATYRQEQLRMSERKKKLIRSLDLVVIDEISMVRADLLDNIDEVLRRHRDRHRPFGGVQLLMIGDLQQLSPVVKDEDWALLSRYYETPYFFSALAFRTAEFATIELQRVYRQSDEHFLQLLNAVRTNTADRTVLEALNRRYLPDFQPDRREGYIRLVTHNHQADQINDAELAALSSRAYTYRALIRKNFPEHAYPTAEELTLKVGAQVIFVKSDSSGEKRYFNGMLGEVVSLSESSVGVRAHDSGEEIAVEREVWLNARYVLNEESKEIEEVVEGSFEQYPLRTAWAITIHKSQGLTFERAIIDATSSFAHGQTYVALSRCKTLEGLVLAAPIPPHAIIQDRSVLQFTRHVAATFPGEERVQEMERKFYLQLVGELFDFAPVQEELQHFVRLLDEHYYKQFAATLADFKSLQHDFLEKVVEVAVRFHAQFSRLIYEHADYSVHPLLQERLQKGASYFHSQLSPLSDRLAQTPLATNNKEVKKRTEKAVAALKTALRIKLTLLRSVGNEGFDRARYQQLRAVAALDDEDETTAPSPSKKRSPAVARPPKEPTYVRSFRLYREGRTVVEVAAERGLSPATVFSHLAVYVQRGDLALSDLVPPDHIDRIADYLRRHPEPATLSDIRREVGADIEFAEIRLVKDELSAAAE